MSRVHTLVWGYPHGRGRCRPEKKRRADIQGLSKREAGSPGAAAEVGGGGEQGKEKHQAAQDLEKVGRLPINTESQERELAWTRREMIQFGGVVLDRVSQAAGI